MDGMTKLWILKKLIRILSIVKQQHFFSLEIICVQFNFYTFMFNSHRCSFPIFFSRFPLFITIFRSKHNPGMVVLEFYSYYYTLLCTDCTQWIVSLFCSICMLQFPGGRILVFLLSESLSLKKNDVGVHACIYLHTGILKLSFSRE